MSFALGSHEDLGEELRSVGLAVVTVHAAEGMVTVKLEEIFRRRIEWARRLEGPVPTISGRTVESLVATYGTGRACHGTSALRRLPARSEDRRC